MPKYLLTGNHQDTEQIQGHIIASSNSDDWIIHLVEENTKTFSDGTPWTPYEDFAYSKIHSRWQGKGIAEKVMWLQLYLNTIMGIRINRSYVSQLGLFQIRAGSNITPQMIGRLMANGAIKVTDIEKDIAPLEFPQSGLAESYKDEANILDWGQRVTSLYDAATGEPEPADVSATATAIQNQSVQSQFVLLKQGLGMFLERWLKHHVLPYVVKNLKQGDVIRLTGETDELSILDEWRVNRELANFIDQATDDGKTVNPSEIAFEKQKALQRLQQSGKARFITVDQDFDITDYDVEIVITNEEINKAVLMQNLMGMLPNVDPGMRNGIVREIFDLVGLDPYQLESKQGFMPPQQPQQQPQGPQTMTGQAQQSAPPLQPTLNA